MDPAVPSQNPLIYPPIAFAHRGARAHAPENTLESFELGLRLGASGLESDAWVTKDGVAVLDHDGVVRKGLKNRRIGELNRSELPGHIPSLEELYDSCGSDYELSLDIKDEAAARAVIDAARNVGGDALGRLWLCHHRFEVVASWRPLDDSIKLVDSTRMKWMKPGPERRAADLADAGVDAINMHFNEWTGGLTALFHRFERITLGWDAQHERMIHELLRIGIDGLFSDYVDRMVDVYRERGLSLGP